MPKINFENGGSGEASTLPHVCPFCHFKIAPVIAHGGHTTYNNIARVIMFCNNETCKETFIAYYNLIHNSMNIYTGHLGLNRTSIGKPDFKLFPDSINKISPDFIEIYNQSFFSEQSNLKQICGVGYRKSIEFLIKDFAKWKEPKENHEKIESIPLMQVIKTYIDHPKIKSNAERAVWLGNDETHYVRKWGDKDLKDLKILIDLTISYIDTEFLSDEFAEEMKS